MMSNNKSYNKVNFHKHSLSDNFVINSERCKEPRLKVKNKTRNNNNIKDCRTLTIVKINPHLLKTFFKKEITTDRQITLSNQKYKSIDNFLITPIKKKSEKISSPSTISHFSDNFTVSSRLNLHRKLAKILCNKNEERIYKKSSYEISSKMSEINNKSNKERPIPKIKSKIGMNNFIIRDSRFISDPIEYIVRSKYNQKVSDEFYKKRKKILKEQIRINADKFYKMKNKMPYEDVYSKTEKEEKKEKRKQDNQDLLTKSENEYKKTKDFYFQSLYKKNQEQSKIIAELILKMKKGENTNKMRANIDENNAPAVLVENLENSIFLKNILKTRNVQLDEDLELNNVAKMKKELKETELETMKALKGIDNPRFLKEKFTNNTQIRFKGLNGKYFGIAC